MNRRLILFVAAVCLATAASDTEPAAIMWQVEQQNAGRNLSLKATFDVYRPGNAKQEQRVDVFELNTDRMRRALVRFLSPADLKGVALLSVLPDNGQEQQWIYIPTSQRVREVARRDAGESFAGTDFTYEDLQPPPASNFTYKLVSSSEKVLGHPTYKIERRPKDPSLSQYAYSYYWVAQNIPCIVFAEMYSAQGQKVRTLSASQFRKVGGVWGARRTEMRTVAAGSRTVLTVDEAKVDRITTPAMFMPEQLGKGSEK